MKFNSKIGALALAVAMGLGMVVGCKDNSKPSPKPEPTKYLVNATSTADYEFGGLTEDHLYVEGATVSFTVTLLNLEKEITAVGYQQGSTKTQLTEGESGYSFLMPASIVSLYVTTKTKDVYSLSLSGTLQVDADPVKLILLLGTDPQPASAFTVEVLEGSEHVTVNEDEVTAVSEGEVKFAAVVGGQQVATCEATVAASELQSIKSALDQAIVEAPCNGKAGNNSAKTTTNFTIAGKIVYINDNDYEDKGSLEVIIDDGTEAVLLIAYSSTHEEYAFTVGDSIKTTCKFTNYYGLFEGIGTASTSSSQKSIYVDQLIQINKVFETQYLQPAAMDATQFAAYAKLAEDNQSATAGAYTDIKYVENFSVTYNKDHVMGTDVFGGFELDGNTEYGFNAKDLSTIEIDTVHGHKSKITGLMPGVNTGKKTAKIYAYSQTPLAVEDIKFEEGEELTIYLNNPVELVYTASPEGSYGTEVWASSDEEVATVENGVVSGLKGGDAVITLTIGDTSKSITIHVSEDSFPCESVEITKDTAELLKGKEETLEATVMPANCTDTKKWSSSDTKVATVDKNGKVTAVAVGTATITLTCGAFSDTCVVTVREQKISDLANAVVGDPVDVYGYVTAQYTVTTRNGLWVCDGNRGIFLYKTLPTDMKIGDVVHVVGAVAANHGGKQVAATTFEKVEDPTGLNIQPATTVDITEEVIGSITSELQGAKATVTGVVKDHTNIGKTDANHTITLTVGSETFKVYAHKDNDGADVLTDISRAAKGTTVTISGFVTANKSNVTDFTTLTKTDYQLVNPTLDEVKVPELTGMELNKDKADVLQGATLQLEAIAQPTGAVFEDTVVWSATGNEKVDVDQTGLVTVNAEAVVGSKATITATSGEFHADCVVTVKSASAVSFEKTSTLATGKYVIGALGNSDNSQYYYLGAPTGTVSQNPAALGPLTNPATELDVENAWDVTVDENDHIIISYAKNDKTYYLEATNKAQGIKIVDTPTANAFWKLDANGLQFSDGGTRYLATYNNGSFRYYSAPLQSGQSMANVFYHYVG